MEAAYRAAEVAEVDIVAVENFCLRRILLNNERMEGL